MREWSFPVGTRPNVTEAPECSFGGPKGAEFALTCEWPDGAETTEYVTQYGAQALGFDINEAVVTLDVAHPAHQAEAGANDEVPFDPDAPDDIAPPTPTLLAGAALLRQLTPAIGRPVGAEVLIDYSNWRGERSTRTVIPTGRLLPGDPTYHPTARWVIEAWDVAKGAMRSFDPAHVHAWGDQQPRSSAAVFRASPAETKATLADATFDIAAPTHRVEAGAVAGDLGGVEALDEEERFLTTAVENAYDPDGPGIMPGDVEGAFHRIRAALDANLAAKDRELDALRRSGAASDGVREVVPAELRALYALTEAPAPWPAGSTPIADFEEAAIGWVRGLLSAAVPSRISAEDPARGAQGRGADRG